ncbi:MAG: putative transcriptional regulator with C-terminal CBS domain [Promethearchaeota archaeon]|nr:MAG: putative transcriptional regulator with C-terminal CBS domain [Candidatus Lokiarchaeota archaeon]
MLPKVIEIKDLRKNLNLSQQDLAEKCGLTQSTISRIESGKIDPPYSKIKLIFDFLQQETSRRKSSTKKITEIMSKKIINISPKDTLKDAITLMSKHNISQLPILENNRNFGSITAKKAQQLIVENPNLNNIDVMSIKELPFPEIDEKWNLRDVSDMLSKYPAILVKKYDSYVGIITDADCLRA